MRTLVLVRNLEKNADIIGLVLASGAKNNPEKIRSAFQAKKQIEWGLGAQAEGTGYLRIREIPAEVVRQIPFVRVIFTE